MSLNRIIVKFYTKDAKEVYAYHYLDVPFDTGNLTPEGLHSFKTRIYELYKDYFQTKILKVVYDFEDTYKEDL